MTLREYAVRVVTRGCTAFCPNLRPRRATFHSFLARDDVHHAADCVCSIQCGALRSANYLDAGNRFGIEVSDEERIRYFDSIDVNLGIAHTKRACAANASIPRQKTQ